jgi:metallo-beta-lactamase family protein
MQMKLQFLGAAQNVTGSRHMLEVNGTRLLVDCGLYQERHFESRNWEPFAIPPAGIDAVLLTHAHLDHCGLLPKLVKEGFKGPIYCTAATAEIARLVLLDSAKLQEEDAAFKRKRHEREGRQGRFPEVPLYDTNDVEACDPLWRSVEYKETVQIGPAVRASFHEAGHVLGSSVIHVHAEQNGEARSVLFSGDVGRVNRPIVRDPDRIGDGDYVLVESTYGDRVHDTHEDIKTTIARTINEAKAAGGNVVIPSFALERSQDVMYYINELMLEKAIPRLRVFLDSPMARSITKVFRRHVELFDEETREFIRNGQSPFDFPGLTLIETTDESKKINHLRGTNVIIAGSGMCTGGRIKHHLVNNISHRKATIMFVGYQAAGTLGRLIVDGEKEVRILGQTYPVRAKVVRIEGFSAHADREELLRWLGTLQTPPRRLFVVHGEATSAQSFAGFIRERTGWNVLVPEFRQEVLLD